VSSARWIVLSLAFAGPAAAGEEPRVPVTIESIDEGLFVRMARLRDDGELDPWTAECRTPCKLALAPGLYRARGGVRPGEPLFTTVVGVSPGGCTIELPERGPAPVAPADNASTRGALAAVTALVVLLAFGAIIGGAVVVVAGWFDELWGTRQDATPKYVAGGLTVGAGLSALVGALYLGRYVSRMSVSLAPTSGGATAAWSVRF
jgi:hypothetical protein